MSAPELSCSLETIFFFIYKSNLNNPNVYTLTENGALKFNEFYNENRTLVKSVNLSHKDSFIG